MHYYETGHLMFSFNFIPILNSKNFKGGRKIDLKNENIHEKLQTLNKEKNVFIPIFYPSYLED